MGATELGSFEIRPAAEHDTAAIAVVFLEAGRAAWSEFVGAERMATVEPPVVRKREWQGAPLRELRYRRRLDPAP